MDTVTLLGAAIRGLLKVAEGRLAAELGGVLGGAEEYAGLAKPQIDWDDQAARAALVDARARDAHAVLGVLQGRPLPAAVAQAAGCWAWWWAKTWSRVTMAASGSPARSPPTG
jgi:hypothetical protein